MYYVHPRNNLNVVTTVLVVSLGRLHFTDEDTEAQGGRITCIRLHSQQRAEQRCKLGTERFHYDAIHGAG